MKSTGLTYLACGGWPRWGSRCSVTWRAGQAGSHAFVLGVVGGGGGGVVWVPGHDYPALAWPRRGHLPGGSKMAATRVVVVRRELVVGRKM